MFPLHPRSSRGSKASKSSSDDALFHERSTSDSMLSGRQHMNKESPLRTESGFFLDPARIKQRVRANLAKPHYDVTEFYWESGFCQAIGRSVAFERITLSVIALNSLWIAIDTDFNEATVLTEAEFIFQFAQHFFCAFFAAEWAIRFGAFKRKRDCLRDTWFVFDSILVFLMMLETWMFTIFLMITGYDAETSSLRDTSVLRIARVLRLARMARMARLLRALPELMILIKGLMAAARSVFFSLCLLLGIIFLFSIGFTQLTDELPIHKPFFDHTLLSMYTLFFRGALLDNSYYLANEIGDSSLPMAGLFVIFVMISAVTLMNMLIGVLVEVVSSVAALEYEQSAMNWVRSKMEPLVHELDEDGNDQISRDEFIKLLQKPDAIQTLHDVGVDPVGLVDYADFIFSDDITGVERADLTFAEFMEIVLELRGSNRATVKDIVDLRKFITQVFLHFENKLDSLFSQRLHDTILSSSNFSSTTLRDSGRQFHSTAMSRKSKTDIMPGRMSIEEIGRGSILREKSKSNVGFAEVPEETIIKEGDFDTVEVDVRSSAISRGSQSLEIAAFGSTATNRSRRGRRSHAGGANQEADEGSSPISNSDLGNKTKEEEFTPSLPDSLDSLEIVQEEDLVQSLRNDLDEAPFFPAGVATYLRDDLVKSLEEQRFQIMQSLPAPPEIITANAVQGASRGLQTSRIRLHSKMHEGHLGDLNDTHAQSIAAPPEPPGAACKMKLVLDDPMLHNLHTTMLKSTESGNGGGAAVNETVL